MAPEDLRLDIIETPTRTLLWSQVKKIYMENNLVVVKEFFVIQIRLLYESHSNLRNFLQLKNLHYLNYILLM